MSANSADVPSLRSGTSRGGELPAAELDDLELRRVTPTDWRALKQLRLAALLDEPTAYCERWVDAAVLDDEAWQARAARVAEGGDSFQVLAWDGARPVATAVGFVEDGTAWLVAVHVTPDLRGRGLLERLIEAVAGWAREQGSPALLLEVHEANARAQSAYRRLGFVDTGRRRPYPLDLSAQELEMALPLQPGAQRAPGIVDGRCPAGRLDVPAST